jgi:hypothetical protein
LALQAPSGLRPGQYLSLLFGALDLGVLERRVLMLPGRIERFLVAFSLLPFLALEIERPGR